jgi:phage terminase large subunit
MEIAGCENDFIINLDEITNKKTGSSIIFKGIKTSSGIQTANLKSLTGVSTWVIDEAEELVDEDTFTKIDYSVRVNKVKNRVIMIMNPATKEHWIYKRFVEFGEQNNTNYIHTTYLDNIKNISEDVLIDYERLKNTNFERYKHIILGGWLDKAEGVIFTNWNESEFDESLPYGFGLDFGFYPDPTALIKVAIDYKDRKIYLKEEIYAYKLSQEDLTSQIKSKCKDSLVICDTNEKRTVDVLRRNGINIKEATKGAGSIIEGIKLMLDYELIITKDSLNLKKELNNYAWHDKKADLPIDSYNHAIDATRYIVSNLILARKRIRSTSL